MYNVERETKQKIHGEKDGQTEQHTAFVYYNNNKIIFSKHMFFFFSKRSRHGKTKKNKTKHKSSDGVMDGSTRVLAF